MTAAENPLEGKKRELKELVSSAALSLYRADCEFEIIRPRSAENGCLSATAALSLGKILRRPPIELAAEMAAEIKLPDGEYAIAMGKGFINFFLKPDFLLSALKRDFLLAPPELPDMSDPDFPKVYPAVRLCAVLEHQGTPPDGEEELSLLSRGEEIRLLWEIFSGSEDGLTSAAMNFYDRVGLRCDCPPLAKARYVLLGNAVGVLIDKFGGNNK